MNGNLYLTLARGFADQPDNCCLRLPGVEDWSFSQLERLSGGMAALLLQRAESGDRVLVQVEKCAAAVALYLACLRAGLVLVPLNTAYTANELDYFRADARPVVEIDDDALRTLATEALETAPLAGAATVSAGDTAAILYTSGTTGRSKGAMLSHGNLASNALTLHEIWGFVPGDVLLHALPIYHVHGLFVALNTALINGSTVIFLERFDVDRVLAELPAATVMMGVPTFYSRLLADPRFGTGQCEHMRLFVSGSAPLTEQTFAAFEARTGHRILERYGMSETGMITSNPLQGERVAGTVGFALPGVDIRVCDDSGRSLPDGEVGVVEVRGPNVFSGYWGMPEKTAEEFRDDGYFITGDLGRLDREGRLTLVGREKDLVITGGLNVYPREVELCLDGIEGIREAAVIGLPHPDFGEAVVAICVAEGDELPPDAAIQAQLQRCLAKFKQPKLFIRVDALPRNTMGKVQKNTLRERYREYFLAENAQSHGKHQ